MASWNLIKLIRYLWDRKKNNEVLIVRPNGDKIILSTANSTEKIEVHRALYQAALNQNIQEDLKQVLKLLLEKGIDKATFLHGSGDVIFTEEDAREFANIAAEEIDPEALEQTVKGHIVIHSPVFEEGSKGWKFKWNGRVESIDVSNTTIPSIVMKRGKVVVGDAFKVIMSFTEKRTRKGYAHKFKVKEVLEFVPSSYEQTEIIWEREDDPNNGAAP